MTGHALTVCALTACTPVYASMHVHRKHADLLTAHMQVVEAEAEAEAEAAAPVADAALGGGGGADDEGNAGAPREEEEEPTEATGATGAGGDGSEAPAAVEVDEATEEEGSVEDAAECVPEGGRGAKRGGRAATETAEGPGGRSTRARR